MSKERLYRKLYAYVEKQLEGGLSYGMDFNTVHAHYPQIATLMRKLATELYG